MNIIKKIKRRLVKVKKEKVVIPVLEGNYLKNRCALITGGSSGIGFAIAQSFVNNGASVIIVGRNEKKLEAARENLLKKCYNKNIVILSESVDVSDINSLKEKFSIIEKKCPYKIDILVNCAGINEGKVFPETEEESFDKIIDTNLKGTYFLSQIVVDYMIKNKIKGNILNVTSSSALRPAISPYIISKWGERALTLGMAKKYLPYGIVVNGIAPGSTATEMLNVKNNEDLTCEYTPTKRYIATEEVGNFATILVSDMGKMIIGDTIYITGGSGVITFDDMNY